MQGLTVKRVGTVRVADTSSPKPAELITITPELAARWLEHSDEFRNRSVSQRMVQRYAEDMRNDRWLVTGETIVLSEKGYIIDGQHRLWAVIEAGKPIKTWVIRGVSDEAFLRIGRGKPRSVADVLHIHGYPNALALQGVLGYLHRYRTTGRWTYISDRVTPRILPEQALIDIEREPAILDMIQKAKQKSYAMLGISRSLLAALMHVMFTIDDEDAEDFFDRLATGVAHSADDPVLRLRNALLKIRADGQRGFQTSANADHLAALTIKAWNAYREGRTIRILRWKSGGAKPEPRPQPV